MYAVIVSFDSLATNSIGCYGNEWIETPHLDRLAANTIAATLDCCDAGSQPHRGAGIQPGVLTPGIATNTHAKPQRGNAVKQLTNRFFAETGEPGGVSPRTLRQFGPRAYAARLARILILLCFSI